MEVTAVIKLAKEVETISDRFRKRDFVATVDFDKQYPQDVLFQLVQDKCELLDVFQSGDLVRIKYNLRGRGREVEGKGLQFFNTLDVWKIEKIGKA